MKIYFETNNTVDYREKFQPVIWHIIASSINVSVNRLEVVPANKADLIIITPFFVWSAKFKIYSRLSEVLNIKIKDKLKFILTKIYGKDKKFLYIGFENLLHPFWGNLGDLLYSSSMPRITSAPDFFDPNGIRMPYWYSYLKFESVDYSKSSYKRFGAFYDIETLMKPLKIDSIYDKGCLIAQNLNGIRKTMYQNLNKNIEIDLYGKVGIPLSVKAAKFDILKKYRYYLATENSLGVGYETEKLPEAWMSGCIPIGCIEVAGGDFNANLYQNTFSEDAVCTYPLLTEEPKLLNIINYIGETLNA